MKKKISYTEEELIQMGKHPEVCWISGNLTNLWVTPVEKIDETMTNHELEPDEVICDINVRKSPPSLLSQLSFQAVSPEDKRIRPAYHDAIGVTLAALASFDILISENAREKLAPHLEDECVFVPTILEGAPQPYYIMWVTNIYDALNASESMILDSPVFPEKRRAYDVKFYLEKIKTRYLFRAPRWKYTSLNYDLALKPFMHLVAKYKLTGFEFGPAGTGLLMKM